MDSQKESVHQYTGNNNLIGEFTDIESGKKNNRIELQKAIDLCCTEDATLVIAKLDRLSRNMAFIASLMDSKVKFVAVDMPEANEFTVHIFAALAQQERKLISERTKAGLVQARIRGKKIGSPQNLTIDARLKGVKNHIQNSKQNENNTRAFALIKVLKANGENWNKIASELNKSGYKTAQGKKFQAIQAQRIFEKYVS